MNKNQLKHILMFLEMGTWSASKTIKKINDGGMAGSADYWTGVSETLEETMDMINQIVKKDKK